MTADVPVADVLIVGGGLAAVHVVTNLRASGFDGLIRVLSAESRYPYDRTPLSKAFMRGEIAEAGLQLKSDAFFEQNGIDWVLGSRVVEVDATAHVVRTETGDVVEYRDLVWATGGYPRRLTLNGADLDGVLSLRSLDDALALRERAAGASTAVIIGGGHIGLEIASSLRHLGLGVTLLEANERLLARVTSAAVSQYYLDLHTRQGVTIVTSAAVEGIEGVAGHATGVRMTDGSVHPADLVVVGVGIIPEVEALALAGVSCSNGVDVDEAGRTTVPHVFAVGDCANMQRAFANGDRIRLESVPNVTEQARNVARSIVGEHVPETSPPWFWSHQYDTKLRTVGMLHGHDEVVLRGDPDAGEFSIVYLRESRIIAIDCVNRMKDFARAKEIIASGVVVDARDVATVEDLRELARPTAAGQVRSAQSGR